MPNAAAGVVLVSGKVMSVGDLPVTLSAVSTADQTQDPLAGHRVSIGAGPDSVQVKVAGQSVTKALGIPGVVVSVARTDGVNRGGRVRLSLDFSKFASAFGGDFGGRLRLVELPACALTTPSKRECQQTIDLASTNAASMVSADVAVAPAGTMTVFAATAGASSVGGDFSSTSLSPSYSWAAGVPGGSFAFSYPMRVPGSLGGPSPDVSLAYDSGSTDAETLRQNGQTSWTGEGWDLDTGFIEKSYRACSLDGGTTADLCQFSQYNATMMFKGASVRLIYDNTSHVWHASADSGYKIDLLTDTSKGNGDHEGEYWRVITQDGTRYYFGINKRYATDTATTNSVLNEPVYGNNSGEPCYNATFASAWCQQAYRWNLDYVVDPSGNSMTYFYNKQSGHVGLNNNTNVQPYDLNSTLDHIDYGTRSGSESSTTAPAQVWFSRTARCINTCQQNTSDYPDTPWDLYCSSTTSCPNTKSPVFFDQYKLSSVYTQVWNAASSVYRKVDQWDLGYLYPSSGDNISPAGADTSPNLWLQTLTHTGYAPNGTSLAEPSTTFDGTAKANRVFWGNSIGVAPYMHYRLTTVHNGTGGQTQIAYNATDCDGSFVPIPDSNPYRCFPQYISPQIAAAGFDWFQKYTVASVTVQDLTGGSPDETTSYAYSTANSSDAGLWHHDYDESTTLAFRSWSLWQGYSAVTATHGAAGGAQTVTKTQYFRGFSGDGKNSTDSQSIAWGARQVGVTEPFGTPNLTSALSGSGTKCLDLAGYGTTNGTAVQSFDCTGATNQVWRAVSNGAGAYSLKNPVSGRCLDLAGYGTANNTLAQLFDCTGAANQLWERQPNGSLYNPVSGRCLDTTGETTVNATRMQLYDCSPEPGQVWQPQSNGSWADVQSARCIDLASYGTANDTRVQDWNCTNATNQLWQLQSNGTLKNPVSGRCLDVTNYGTTNGSLIHLWDCLATTNQIWVPQSDGSIRNPASGRCLDPGTATLLNGTQLQLYDCTGDFRQKWLSAIPDAEGTQGFQREQDGFDQGLVRSSTFHTPTVTQTATRSAPASGGQNLTALMTTDTEDQTRNWTAATSTWRWTDAQTSYNTYGLPTFVKSLRDTSTSVDDTCTATSYVTPDTTNWLVNYPASITTTDCATSPGDADYLSGSQIYYDGSAINAATPTAGLATKTTVLIAVSSGAMTWSQASRTDYDSYGRPSNEYDQSDRKTTTAYVPSTGGPLTGTTTTDPMGFITAATVDPGHGTDLTTTDANNKITTMVYDPLGRLTTVYKTHTSPTTSLPDVSYVYTLSTTAPNVIETRTLTGSNTQVSSYSLFDGQMRPRQTQQPAPQANGGRIIADTAYDTRGMRAKTTTFWNSTAPAGTLASYNDTDVDSQTRYTYDGLGRTTVNALWSRNTLKWQTSTAYDGDRTTVVPPDGGAQVSMLDAVGRNTSLLQYPTSSISGTPETTSYGYDRLDNLVKLTDPAGNNTTYSYDLLGRRTSTTDPDGGTNSTNYNTDGTTASATDARNQKMSYQYDALGRLTTRWAGDAGSGTKLASYTYDTIAKGELSSTTRYVGNDSYVLSVDGYTDNYQPTGQTVAVPLSEHLLAGSYDTTLTYNLVGQPTSTTFPAAGGLPAETVNYGYDTTGHPTTLAGASTYVSSTAYTGLSQLAQRVYGANGPAQLTRSYTWDPATGRLTNLAAQLPNAAQPTSPTTVQNDTYSYAPTGDITSVADGTDNQSQCYRYDGQHRLTDAWTATDACAANPSTGTITSSGKYPYWDSWAYDSAGRRTNDTHRVSSTGTTTRTFTYPAVGAAQVHAASSVQYAGTINRTDTMHYDASGNTTDRTINGVVANYGYDAESRFSTATVHASGGDQTTNYVYDADGGLLIRRDPAGSTLYLGGEELRATGSTVSVTRYYRQGGATVAVRTLAGLSWLAADTQDSATIAVDSSTAAVQRHWYTPYGADRATTGTWPSDRGFLNKQTNSTTGLLDDGFREYDPTLGTFLAADPLIKPGDPTSFNPYSYADNNPISHSDPSGLSPSGDGNQAAHDTAIMLRMRDLQAAYPNAHISGDIGNAFGGADVICWDCNPGTVLIWEVKPSGTSSTYIQQSMQQDRTATEADARTRNKDVEWGPDFADSPVDKPWSWSGTLALPEQLIVVYDSGIEGLQSYKTGMFKLPISEEAGKKISQSARDTASKLNKGSDHWTYSRKNHKNRSPAPPSWSSPKSVHKELDRFADDRYGLDRGECPGCRTSSYGSRPDYAGQMSQNTTRAVEAFAIGVGIGFVFYTVGSGIFALAL